MNTAVTAVKLWSPGHLWAWDWTPAVNRSQHVKHRAFPSPLYWNDHAADTKRAKVCKILQSFFTLGFFPKKQNGFLLTCCVHSLSTLLLIGITRTAYVCTAQAAVPPGLTVVKRHSFSLFLMTVGFSVLSVITCLLITPAIKQGCCRLLSLPLDGRERRCSTNASDRGSAAHHHTQPLMWKDGLSLPLRADWHLPCLRCFFKILFLLE